MEELNVTVKEGTETLEIRQGQALELREPEKLQINGNIDTVSRFLEKRIATIDQLSANIEISRLSDKMRIDLEFNETSYYAGNVVGAMELHEDFVAFGINTPTERNPRELSDFIKMHRWCFEDSTIAMKLVAELRAFKGKVNKDMESKSDDVGNKRDLMNQIVESNIPKAFVLHMPIFKGGEKKKFEVEIHINPRDHEMDCLLASVEAKEIRMDYRNTKIDIEIEKIRGIAPDILIYEG